MQIPNANTKNEERVQKSNTTSNGSTFCAAADALLKLLDSSEFVNSVRKRGINWVRIPPYAPSQGGSWEIMVKSFKTLYVKLLAMLVENLLQLNCKRLCPTPKNRE